MSTWARSAQQPGPKPQLDQDDQRPPKESKTVPELESSPYNTVAPVSEPERLNSGTGGRLRKHVSFSRIAYLIGLILRLQGWYLSMLKKQNRIDTLPKIRNAPIRRCFVVYVCHGMVTY